MKRIVALFLTAAMLLGMTGTVAFAAEAATMPEVKATVSDDGTVTVTADGDYTSAYAYVYTKDGGSTYYVRLAYDKDKKAWIGQNENVGGGAMDDIYLSKSKTEWNEDNTAYTDTSYRVSVYYDRSSGKQYYESVNNSTSDYKQFKYKYKNREGETVEGSSFIWVKQKSESDSVNYSTQTGKKTSENHSISEGAGDNKTRKTESKNEYKYYDSETGEMTSEQVTNSTTESVSKISEYGGISFSDKSQESASETKNYTSKGEYNGRSESKGSTTYTYNDKNQRTKQTAESASKSYYKDDQIRSNSWSNSETTYEEGYEKTYSSKSNSRNYSYMGVLKSTSTSENSRENKIYKDESGYTSSKQVSSKSSSNSYNKDGELSSASSSVTTYGDDNSYSSSSTSKSYNTYTGNLQSESTSQTVRDKDYNYSYASSEARYNDDGSLRYRIVNDFDGTETHYNQNGAVAAKRDKEGTWTDGSGKVLGKNFDDPETGNHAYSYVNFKNRTGEISGYYSSETKVEDGKTTQTYTNYEDGEVTYSSKTISNEDGSSERYEDGHLYETVSKDGETKYYDRKGTVSSYSKIDAEKNETTWYDYDGKKTSMNGVDKDGLAYGEYYDDDEKLASSWKRTKDGATEHYDADNMLTYSQKYEDGADVYYGKDGKEFARTYYNKYDNKTKTYTTEHIYDQDYYDENGNWISGNYNGFWDPESNSGVLEKIVSKSESKDRTTTSTEEYTKWTVTNGKKGDNATRTEESVSKSADDHYESSDYVDGVLTHSLYDQYDNYGNSAKITDKYYNRYTGKLTSALKRIYTGVDDDPVYFDKNYDRNENLATYAVVDDTDRWNWTHTFYEDGTPAGESWYDGLDGDEDYSVRYYRNGQISYEYTSDGDAYTSARYNEDGSYAGWTERGEDGATNTWYYDNKGGLHGYRWNEHTDEDTGVYSYEEWDESKLLYTYTSESLASGWTSTKADPAGNKLIYKNGEYDLELVNKEDGWQEAVGEWFYIENGVPVQQEWRNLDGGWYYFGYDGSLQTGITVVKDEDDDDAVTYALDNNGAMTFGGWVNLDEYGNMAYADGNGEVVTGWQQIDGKWYYFTDGWSYNEADYKADADWVESDYKGRMVTGAARLWKSDYSGKHTYFFNEDGSWDTTPGWKTANVDGAYETHYFYADGSEAVGWVQIGGDWFYFNEDGVLRNGWVGDYYMDPQNGSAMSTGGWVEDVYEGWYFIGEDGTRQKGWKEDGGSWYFLKEDGAMAADEFVKSEEGKYRFGADGVMQTGWQQDGNQWYYLDPATGLVQTGEVTIDGVTYEFDESGALIE